MKVFKIHVQEKTQTLRDKISYIEEDVMIFEELPQENQLFVMNEYSKGPQNKLLRIGVESEEASRISVIGENTTTELIQSKTKPGFWYEQSNSWIENGFPTRSDSCFGINACGQWEIIAYNVHNDPIEKKKVLILPSTLSIQQYKLMQLEVKSLFEALAFTRKENNEKNYLKETQTWLYPLDQLVSLMEDLSPWMEKVIENPMEQLEQIRKKQLYTQIKKWDSHSVIERAVFPYRNKISVRETVKNTDIIEHKMILGALETIKSRILQETAIEKAILNQLNDDLITRLELLNMKSVSFKAEMEQRCTLLQKDKSTLEERQKEWGNCLGQIETYLEADIFQTSSVEMNFTHLFVSEPSYMTIFNLLEKIECLAPQLESQKKDFIEAMMNSPHLYEVWMLLQLIHQFRRLKFDCSKAWESLFKKYEENNSLRGWRFRMSPKNPELLNECVLFYEPTIKQDNDQSLKPDYFILYRSSPTEDWQGHTLDAKYKPYSSLSQNVINNDLERSGRRYYQNLNKRNVVMKSAALVHIDRDSVHWNVDEGRIYETSHFSAIPGELKNLEIYMTRLLHYHFRLEKICPSCGGAVTPRDQGYKVTYICENDGEVWVSNTCRYKRRFHPDQDIRLMKYVSLNYNVQVQDNWDVHCPACTRDYNGNVLELNVLGHS